MIEHVDSGERMKALHMLTPEVRDMHDTIQEQAEMLDNLTREIEKQRQLAAQYESLHGKPGGGKAPIAGAPPKLIRNRILKQGE